jgi:hypothetical protein
MPDFEIRQKKPSILQKQSAGRKEKTIHPAA